MAQISPVSTITMPTVVYVQQTCPPGKSHDTFKLDAAPIGGSLGLASTISIYVSYKKGYYK